MNATQEEWRPVVGYEGIYEISNMGRIRSVDRTVLRSNGVTQRLAGKLMSPNIIKGNYRQAHLTVNGKSKMRLIHHLVLESFTGSCPTGYEACHNDGDPGNNRLSNLRWDTPSANTHDRVKHGTHHEARKQQCPKGHDYDYFYKRPDGGINRCCRTCRRDEQRRRAKRKKEQSDVN